MKILFLISINSHGVGGHVNTINQITKELEKSNQIRIVSIGGGNSQILKSNINYYKHIRFRGYELAKVYSEIEKICKVYSPEIIHCFDVEVFSLLKPYFIIKRKNVVLSLCGGKNPKVFPAVSNLILFSMENFNWFKRRKKYRNTYIKIIPNRIKEQNLVNQNIYREKYLEFTFVRISRIGRTYKKSIFDSINLINLLLKKGIKDIKLVIIGVIEDIHIFNEISSNELVKNGIVNIITDEDCTNEASKMLYLADAVIGTGRGAIEAASLYKPILLIDSKENIPVLLNDNNYVFAMKRNFSERNIFSKYNSEENVNNIIRLINDERYCINAGQSARKIFDKYYNISEVSKKYNEYYNDIYKKDDYLISDFIFFLLAMIKYYINKKSN